MEKVFICPKCGEAIAQGEEKYSIGGNYYHATCVTEDCCVLEVLDMLGIKREIA